ncbi:MAG: DUF4397 domain-containing protein [Trueperaceae bacterium]
MRRVILAILALLAVCSAVAQPLAALRLTHLSPDAPRMDLVIDHRLFLRDVAYGQVTPYSSLPAGQHEISVIPHRLPDAAAQAEDEGPRSLEPITILVELDEGMYYTLAVSGFYQRTSGAAATGALAIAVEPSDATLVVSGPRGFSRRFEGEEMLDGLEPGDYRIRAEHEGHRAATFEISVREAEVATVSISLQEGEGDLTDAGPQVASGGAAAAWRPVELHAFRDDLSAAPPPGGSRVRLIHLSPTTLSVDLLAIASDGGGEPVVLATGLSFPNASAYTRLPGREFTLQIRLAGTDAILAQIPALTIEAGGVYTLFLVREPEDNYLRLIPAVDLLLSVRH